MKVGNQGKGILFLLSYLENTGSTFGYHDQGDECIKFIWVNSKKQEPDQILYQPQLKSTASPFMDWLLMIYIHQQYAVFLAILLLLEMTAGILGFIFKDWVSTIPEPKLLINFSQSTLIFLSQIKQQATSGFQAFIVHYRDDPDQQNLIDWIQEGWVSLPKSTSWSHRFQGL